MAAVSAASRSRASECCSDSGALVAWAWRNRSSAARAASSSSSNLAARATSVACCVIACWLAWCLPLSTRVSVAESGAGLARRDQPGLPREVVPAEPEPAEQDHCPASPRAHDVPEPLTEGRDAAGWPSRDELEHEQRYDHAGEAGDRDDAGCHGCRHRRTSAHPASSQISIATLFSGCGAISGLTISVSAGCHGRELSLNADASHSKRAATQIAQYENPVTSSRSGGGMRSGGRQMVTMAMTAPGTSTPISAAMLNGARPAATQQ